MWTQVKKLMNIRQEESDAAAPTPEELGRAREADLLAQLHQYYDREKLSKCRTVQLEAEVNRLRLENGTLREDRQDRTIEALAKQAVDRTQKGLTPLHLPCSIHRKQRISFGMTIIRPKQAANNEIAGEWRLPENAHTA